MTEPQPGEWWFWTNDPEHPFVIRDVDAFDVVYEYMHNPGVEYSLPIVDVTVAARRVVSA
jgi:hypothetical protein